MSVEFPNRDELMFGRKQDIDALCLLASDQGITFVTGRPKMGKTWVLQEIGRRLAFDEKQWTNERAKFLVGYHECLGEQDQLLRAVSDLYARWLEQADNVQQALSLWRQHRGRILDATAKAVGDLFEKFDPLKPVGIEIGGLVKSVFERLIAANVDLKTGGLQTPKLPYDVTRDLIQHLAKLAGQRVVLILDGWDQSSALDHERKLLDAYLKHSDEWPEIHFFIGVRHPEINEATGDTPAYAAAERLTASSARARFYELKPLALVNLNDGEAVRLLRYLRELLPNAGSISDGDLLKLLSGYPGTLDRWSEMATELRKAANIRTELAKAAADAEVYRFPEFQAYLPKLANDEWRLALRLAIVPRLDAATWTQLYAILNDGLPADTWRKLVRARVLDDATSTHPTFGHDTRHRAARHWFITQRNLRADLRCEAESLIVALAGQIRSIEPRTDAFCAAILSAASVLEKPAVSRLVQAICASVLSLWGKTVDVSIFANVSEEAARAPGTAVLFSMALVNVIYDATTGKQPAQPDAALEELRKLQRAHSEDTVLREPFAVALFDMICYAIAEKQFERRDALLEELRSLQRLHSDDVAVLEQFAHALFNVINEAKVDGQSEQWDVPLEELRGLKRAYPEDGVVREQFAKALMSGIRYTKAEKQRGRRDALLEELRGLVREHQQDAATRAVLAKALFNVACHEAAAGQLERRDAILAELCRLQRAHPNDVAIREAYVKALVNVTMDLQGSGKLEQWDALLEELRGLQRRQPEEEGEVLKALAMALFNVTIHAKMAGQVERRVVLLEELRCLQRAHPGEQLVNQLLAEAQSM